MNKKTRLISLLCSAIWLATPIAYSAEKSLPTFENQYLSDITEQSKDLAKSYTNLTQGASKTVTWLPTYGVATPGVKVLVNEKEYIAFGGCEPHNCPNSSYVVVLDPSTQQFIKGAVRYETKTDEASHQTQLVWLGDYDEDFVPIIWNQFYPMK